jgi:hypothetical protein
MKNIPRTARIAALIVSIVAIACVLSIVLTSKVGHGGARHISVANFTITAQASVVDYAITATQANSIATNRLAQDSSGFSGYVLVAETLVPGLTQVADPTGALWYSSTTAEDDFVLVYSAPPQGGYQYIAALVTVRAADGSVSGYQVRGSNDPRDVLPLPVAGKPCMACP